MGCWKHVPATLVSKLLIHAHFFFLKLGNNSIFLPDWSSLRFNNSKKETWISILKNRENLVTKYLKMPAGTAHCLSTSLLVDFRRTSVPTGPVCPDQFSFYPLSLINEPRGVTACHSPNSHLQGNPTPNQIKEAQVDSFVPSLRMKLPSYGNIFGIMILFFELRTFRIFWSLLVHSLELQHKEDNADRWLATHQDLSSQHKPKRLTNTRLRAGETHLGGRNSRGGTNLVAEQSTWGSQTISHIGWQVWFKKCLALKA